MTKQELLIKLRGMASKYKRYTGMPLRYRGGKSALVGFIIEQLPDELPEKVISPFFGGGSVEIAIAKELGINVIGFDIFDILVNYWQVQINQPEELYNTFFDEIDTELYKDILNKLYLYRDKDKSVFKSNIELAAYFWMNHNLSFGPDSFSHYPSKERLVKKTFDSLKNRVKDFNVKNIEVYNDSFENVMPKFNNDFMYLDPPYYVDKISTYCALYPNVHSPYFHNGFNHQLLADLLHQHRGRFLLSYNDCDFAREMYKDFNIIEIPVKYGLNTIVGKTKKTNELLIKDYN